MTNRLPYLSSPWFRAVEQLLGQPTDAGDVFVLVSTLSDRLDASYTTHFSDGGVTRWTLRSADGDAESRYDLALRRSTTVDEGDLLGRCPPQGVAIESAVEICGCLTDILGLSRLPLYPLRAGDNLFASTVQINVGGSPFGDIVAWLCHDRGERMYGLFDCPADRSINVEITCTYRQALRWLHGDATLGHLTTEGLLLQGDIFHMGAVEGYVSAEARMADPARNKLVEVLDRYASMRHAAISTLDAIEELTA